VTDPNLIVLEINPERPAQQVPSELLELLAPQDQSDHQVFKVPLELLPFPEHQAHKDPLDLKDARVLLDLEDQLDLKDPLDHLDLKDVKDLLDQLVLKVHQD